MDTLEVEMALAEVARQRKRWNAATRKFRSEVEYVMDGLLYHAVANRMAVEDVARLSNQSRRQIRARMRRLGMDPNRSLRLLAKQAADALAENAAIMGISPRDMDLTSPLAYLPMGGELKERFLETQIARVNEDPLVDFVCPVPGCYCGIEYRAARA